MNIYNIIVIILISYLVYKNKNINFADVTCTIVISQIIICQYIKHKKNENDIMYNQFEYDRLLNKKIYDYNTSSYNTFNDSKHSGIHGNNS